jgi:hypothetical protein
MHMTIKIDFKFLIMAIVGFTVAGMTVTETIDQFITFAGEANALGFFLMSAGLGMIGLFGAFERVRPTK